jgi:hypothetical protein
LKAALVAGRTAVWFQNQIIGPKQHLSAMFAASVKISPVHFRSKDTVWLEMHNRCELDIELNNAGTVGPAKITLPARVTSLIKFTARKEELAKGLSYKASNFLVGPKQPLAVKLTIPE